MRVGAITSSYRRKPSGDVAARQGNKSLTIIPLISAGTAHGFTTTIQGMMMRTNCLGSLQAALKDAGLEDRYNDISPGIMAERLRPRPQARPIPTDLSKLVAQPSSPRRRTAISSVSLRVLLLAFALGLIPSLAIAAAIWFDKSRTVTAYPCTMRTAAGLLTTV